MNINLSSVSASPKAAGSVTSGEEVVSEASESGGFFSKLASMIKGEGKADGEPENIKAVENESDSEVSVDGEAKVKVTESQSTEELLSADDKSVEKENTPTEADSDEAIASKGMTDQDAKVETSESASKIVTENDEVLQRLNESSNALKPKDGKELPQDSEASSDNSKQSLIGLNATQGPDKEQKLSQVDAKLQSESVVKSETATQIVMNEDGEEVAVPAGVAPFIQQQTTPESKEGLESETQRATVAAGVIGASSVDAETIDGIEHVPSQKNVEATAQDLANDGSKIVSDSVAEPVMAAGVAAAVTTNVAPVASAEIQVAGTDSQAQSSQGAAITSGVTDGEVDPTMMGAGPATAAAIAWAASSDGNVTQEVTIKSDAAPKAQQAAVAQSVQQALGQQQAHVAQNVLQPQSVQQAVAAMPADLAAMQMQQVATAPNVAVAQDQALLKAAMGAKAAGTIGQVAKNGEAQQPGQESSFAHQLSQAAGVQGSNSLGQARADQVAAQAPLQLNREMASEQVAERVQMMLSKNLKNIDIRLDPPELGRMQIRMNMNGDGATVHFTVANQQARDVIEQSMPRLREMLAQQGVQLNDSSVHQQASQQQRGYANAGQGQTGQGNSNQTVSGEENLEADINLDLNVAAKRDGISYYA